MASRPIRPLATLSTPTDRLRQPAPTRKPSPDTEIRRETPATHHYRLGFPLRTRAAAPTHGVRSVARRNFRGASASKPKTYRLATPSSPLFPNSLCQNPLATTSGCGTIGVVEREAVSGPGSARSDDLIETHARFTPGVASTHGSQHNSQAAAFGVWKPRAEPPPPRLSPTHLPSPPRRGRQASPRGSPTTREPLPPIRRPARAFLPTGRPPPLQTTNHGRGARPDRSRSRPLHPSRRPVAATARTGRAP